jgi:uncharacterized protein YndB with AHSA1/START domain
MPKSTDKIAGMSSAAVEAKTGKGWAGWFALLNKRGCRLRSHREIAALLHDELGCPPWWSQMVTVGYEQYHGLREKHQKPDGYSISRSKTLPVSVASVYRAWVDAAVRQTWLGESRLSIRKATKHKSIRITWENGKTTVEVMFYPKGEGKCQVSVQHNKLASAAAGEKQKRFWGRALERLADQLSTTT